MTCHLTDTDVNLVSSEDSGKTFVYVFFYSVLKSALLGGFSLGDRQLYLLHAFTPISGSGLKPPSCLSIMVLVYAAPKLNSSFITNVLQWNPNITICQGSTGIRSLYRGIVILLRLPI